MAENAILQELEHPFIVNMKYAFQDRDNLYVIMRNFSGGDFRFHLYRNRVFTESQTKNFAACIVLALEYVHSRNIIHRDLKPENLVFDENGYLYLTDFGVAKYWRAENSENTSGTPGYMAPEVLCHQNHSFSVDYYALGIIVFECMTGHRPHNGKTRKEIKDQILAKQCAIKENMVVGEWSPESLAFSNALVQRKREKRLGENGISEVKNHPWFKGYNWDGLAAQTTKLSYIPNMNEATFDRKNAMKDDDKFDENELKQLRRKTIQNSFKGYEFNFMKTVKVAVGFEREKGTGSSHERLAAQSTASS